mmetsp:Transcript_23321/g.35332  ORF Transcript_23321/g.35332 Transcript_23321/m.35332 type:complete len:177 (+) Transcript_23321:328-858(+)
MSSRKKEQNSSLSSSVSSWPCMLVFALSKTGKRMKRKDRRRSAGIRENITWDKEQDQENKKTRLLTFINILHQRISGILAVIQKMVRIRSIDLCHVSHRNERRRRCFSAIVLSDGVDFGEETIPKTFSRAPVSNVVKKSIECLLIQHIPTKEAELHLEVLQRGSCIGAEVLSGSSK